MNDGNYESILAKIKAPVDPLQEAIDALEGLVAVQNGPPLIRDKRAWEAAMETAQEVLTKHGRLQQ